MRADQFDLFDTPPPGLPEGLGYAPDIIAPDEATRLVEAFATLPFEAFDFMASRAIGESSPTAGAMTSRPAG